MYWVAQHSITIERLLKALADAEDFITRHPDEARAIVQKQLNYDNAYIASNWPQHKFSLSLDFSLVTALNDEARWMIGNNLTTEKTMPDFLNYVYLDDLKAVKPETVNIIR